jgi:hypothetical protein
MNDRELERLMNDQLDGVATPQDSERLSKVLETREDARAAYRKLGAVFSALSRVEMEDPPSDLKQNALRAIRQRAGQEAGTGWVDSFLAVLRGRPALRYAYSFAGGAALGVLAFALVTGNLLTKSGLDPSSFTGAMVPPPGAASYKQVGSKDFPLHGGRVRVETFSGKEGIAARITVRAPKGTDLVLSFPPDGWSATGVRQDSSGNEVMLGFDRLSVRIQQFGESQYLLYLARRGPAGSPLRIAIHSPDGFVHSELETGARRSGS